jgi:hypothetical protein
MKLIEILHSGALATIEILKLSLTMVKIFRNMVKSFILTVEIPKFSSTMVKIFWWNKLKSFILNYVRPLKFQNFLQPWRKYFEICWNSSFWSIRSHWHCKIFFNHAMVKIYLISWNHSFWSIWELFSSSLLQKLINLLSYASGRLWKFSQCIIN